MTKQQKIARKAVKTTKARKAFRDHFGQNTYDAVKNLVNGQSGGINAAIKANFTRGTYDSWIKDCNF
jgi:hypothetical protein